MISSRLASSGDAPRTHVVQGRLVELADGGAVLAGDLVGQDLESGQRVHLGLLRQQEVVIRLLGIGAVGAGANVDSAVPDTGAGVVEHAAVRLAARAVLRSVHHRDLLIERLLAEAEVEPGQVGVGALAGEVHVVGDSAVVGAQVEEPGAQRAAGCLDHIDPTEVDLGGGRSWSMMCSRLASSAREISLRTFEPPNASPLPMRVSTTVAELPAAMSMHALGWPKRSVSRQVPATSTMWMRFVGPAVDLDQCAAGPVRPVDDRERVVGRVVRRARARRRSVAGRTGQADQSDPGWQRVELGPRASTRR